MLAVRSDIPCQLIDSPCELEIVSVKLNYYQPVVCCLTYIPPNSSITQYENLFNFLNSTNIGSVNLIILGDFNIPDIDWNTLSGFSPVSRQFCDLVFDSGLSQLINCTTHIHGNILDLLLTNSEELIQCTSVDNQS